MRTSQFQPRKSLRRTDKSWQDALGTWLHEHVLCEEARRYVGNFLSVHRVRPQDEASEDGNSDDIVSDEELQVSLCGAT